MTHRPSSETPPLHDLTVLLDVARALTSSRDLDSILHVILRQMERYFEPESWSLLMTDECRGDLYYAVSAGEPAPHASQAAIPRIGRHAPIRMPLSEGAAGWVATHGESLIVPDAAADSRFGPGFTVPGHPAAVPVRSILGIPLRWRDRTVGVLQLVNYRPSTLTGDALTFLHVLAEYAAIAMENARAIQRIQELTITDECTGLYNSRHLFSVMERELERSRRFHLPCSLVFIDLDHFKRVNDRYGHLIGSRLLVEVATTIGASVRAIDSAFRYGGDEFVVLLPRTPKEAALGVTRRLLASMRAARYLREENLSLSISASFGIATFPEDGSSPHEIIGVADSMMYLVKNTTRDNIAIAPTGCVPG